MALGTYQVIAAMAGTGWTMVHTISVLLFGLPVSALLALWGLMQLAQGNGY
jgi:hypothetical protein